MKTKNDRLLKTEENKAYYSHSDGNFLDIRMATKAHQVLDRIAWAREWVHKLGSQYHLDFGCKDGYFDLTLAAEGLDCIGIDPSVDAIEEATLRSRELGLDDSVSFNVGTVEAFKLGYKFDTVSLLEVIEHVVDPESVVQKLAQLGHFVLITTPDVKGKHGLKDSEQNEEHVRLYSKEELEALCRPYGEVIECIEREDAIYIVFKSNL